jgi:hypothetical protein
MTTKADSDVMRELEAVAADRSAGFWSQVLAVSAIRMVTQRDAKIDSLRTDLKEAARTLRRYEELHRAKNAPDSLVKAEVNAALAARFEQTLASPAAGS